MKFNLHRPFKEIKYLLVAMGSAFLVFDLNYYLMLKLPGSRNEMCVMGVNLNAGNVVFSIVLSLLTGILLAGMIAVFAGHVSRNKAALASVTGMGLGIGTFTLFCPICAVPILSIGSASLFFQLFNDYNFVFKLLAVVLVGVALIILNSQLTECEECVYKPKSKKS
jgi:hypothetical protein